MDISPEDIGTIVMMCIPLATLPLALIISIPLAIWQFRKAREQAFRQGLQLRGYSSTEIEEAVRERL